MLAEPPGVSSEIEDLSSIDLSLLWMVILILFKFVCSVCSLQFWSFQILGTKVIIEYLVTVEDYLDEG